jgi:hypothetical protein
MAIEPVPYIDPAPVPGPQRGDESTFDDRMDAKIRWDENSAQQFGDLADNVAHNAGEAHNSAVAADDSAISSGNYAAAAQDSAIDAADSADAANASATNASNSADAAANSAAGIAASSTTSLAVGAGTKVFTVPAGKQFLASVPMVAVSASDPTKRMFGSVQDYIGPTLTLNITSFDGTGTANDWNISPSGAKGATGGTAGGQLTGALDELKGSDLVAASTVDPWSTGGNLMNLTGNAAITAIANAPQAGAKRTLLVTGTPMLTSNASIIVKGGSVALLPGDEVQIRAETTTKFRVTVFRAAGAGTTMMMAVISTSGTFTIPAASFEVEVQAGGNAAKGSQQAQGTSGADAGWCGVRRYQGATVGATATVVVGAAGVGAFGDPTVAGGNSSFALQGFTTLSASTVGVTNADMTYAGQKGLGGQNITVGAIWGGVGGSSRNGFGGDGVNGNPNAVGYGAGGSGVASGIGGNGAPGVVIVRWMQ